MKKKLNYKIKKAGFTLIEVILFLALSSSLIIGIVVATNASVARQRYNDSVNDFADFLRGTYSQVMNVEHDKKGNTGEAVYGKLITFREDGTDTIYSYDIIGKAVNSANIISLGTDTLTILKDDSIQLRLNTSNKLEYNIPWEAFLEKVNSSSSPSSQYDTVNDTRFVGTVMIVRSPVSGTVRTFTASGEGSEFNSATASALVDYIKADKFGTGDLDFCLDSDDNNYGNRRDIRLLGGGNNSTAVNMVAMDEGDSRCKGK